MVEARGASTLLVLLLAPARNRNQQYVRTPGLAANFARDFISSHTRHADVENHDMRLPLARHLQRLLTGIRDQHLVAAELEHHAETLGRVPIVIGHKDGETRFGARGRRRALKIGGPGRRGHHHLGWQTDRELASEAEACAVGCHGAPVQPIRPRTSARPMPSPPSARSMAESSCENISNMLGAAFGSKPMPLSLTDIKRPLESSVMVRMILPLASVYFAAFVSKFESDCEMRSGSTDIITGHGGSCTER